MQGSANPMVAACCIEMLKKQKRLDTASNLVACHHLLTPTKL